MGSDQPELAEVIERALATAFRRAPRALPAKVVKWDASKQKADCKVLIKQAYFDEEDNRQVESIAVISGVPVMFAGSGTARTITPISDGSLTIGGAKIPATTGLLIWCDRSMDKWLSGEGREVDPEFDHQNGFSDAVFIPGLNPFGAPLEDVPTDYMSIGFDGGMQIKIKNNVIEAGTKDAVQMQLVALSNLVKQQLDAIQSELDAFATAYGIHTHSAPAFGGTTSTPNAGAHSNTYTAGEVAAANLKAEQ